MTCKESDAGVLGAVGARRAQEKHDAKVRAQAVRDYQQAQQAPRPRPARQWFDDTTRTLQKVVLGVIVVCAMAAMGDGAAGRALGVTLQVLVWMLVAIVLAAAVAAGFLLMHLRRRRPYMVEAVSLRDQLERAERRLALTAGGGTRTTAEVVAVGRAKVRS